jgi:hypothetical protein
MAEQDSHLKQIDRVPAPQHYDPGTADYDYLRGRQNAAFSMSVGASSYAIGVLAVSTAQVELKVGATPVPYRRRLSVFCVGSEPVYLIEDGGGVATGYPLTPGESKVFDEHPGVYTAKYVIASSAQSVAIIEEGN